MDLQNLRKIIKRVNTFTYEKISILTAFDLIANNFINLITV